MEHVGIRGPVRTRHYTVTHSIDTHAVSHKFTRIRRRVREIRRRDVGPKLLPRGHDQTDVVVAVVGVPVAELDFVSQFDDIGRQIQFIRRREEIGGVYGVGVEVGLRRNSTRDAQRAGRHARRWFQIRNDDIVTSFVVRVQNLVQALDDLTDGEIFQKQRIRIDVGRAQVGVDVHVTARTARAVNLYVFRRPTVRRKHDVRL